LQVNSGATAPEWATPAATGTNWSLLNAGGTALTGAQTITVSGISGKNEIFILIDQASSASASSEICIRFNTDTAANYNSYGNKSIIGATYATANYFSQDQTSQTSFAIGQMSGAATSKVNGFLHTTGTNSSGVKFVNFVGGGTTASSNSNTQIAQGGFYNSSSVITSVSAFSSTGNFDGGTIFVYTTA
jgi:hypothetical protein